MPGIKFPDYEAEAVSLASSGDAVSREEFETDLNVRRIHSCADAGKIKFALRNAYAAGWNAYKSECNK